MATIIDDTINARLVANKVGPMCVPPMVTKRIEIITNTRWGMIINNIEVCMTYANIIIL
jgi:hypothetical protein